jgi:DNA-binding transcriptional MerR regulator
MERPDFSGLSLEEIRDNLEAECVRKENSTFIRPMTPDELEAVERDYLEGSKRQQALEAELEAISKPIREQITDHKKLNKELLTTIRSGGTEVTDNVYLIPDYSSETMSIFAEDGKLISARSLFKSERQLSINSHLHFRSAVNE